MLKRSLPPTPCRLLPKSACPTCTFFPSLPYWLRPSAATTTANPSAACSPTFKTMGTTQGLSLRPYSISVFFLAKRLESDRTHKTNVDGSRQTRPLHDDNLGRLNDRSE